MPRRKASTISVFSPRRSGKGSPSRGAGSAQPRLRGCCRSAGIDPSRKFSLRFGKEETSTEDKRRRLRRLVPPWSFLTRLRRPYLFSRKRKDRGEKSAWRRGVHSASEFRRTPMFRASFHTILTLRMSWYAPPDTGASDLIPVAVERLPSIEGVVKIQIICTFLRGVLGLYAPNGLPWGKLERRSRD